MGIPNIITRTLKLFKTARAVAEVRKAGSAGDKERAQAALAHLFADARGVTMKIGQLFSEMGDASAFDQLAKGVKPYPLSHMLPVLEAGIGHPVADVFADIEEHAIAASLGQVHKARLRDGDVVAVKIRYPNIAQAVHSEMKIAGLIPNIGPAKKWGIDLNGYKKTLKDNMDRELDYRTEATRQEFYKKTVNVAGLCVPNLYLDLCSEAVLVQNWEEGVYLDDIADWPASEHDQVSRIILETFLYSLFIAGEVHGDPHLGNSLYRQSDAGLPEMVLLDYGCTISVSEQQRHALIELILACRDGGVIPAYELLVELGFDAEKLSHIKASLPEACRLILKPFLIDAPFDSKTWAINEGFTELLGDLKWWFRSAGPSQLMLAIRAFHGVIAQLERLHCRLPWWGVLSTVLGDKNITQATVRLEMRRNGFTTNSPKADPVALAEKLCIRVTENAEEIVSVAMPAGAAYRLIEIIPPDVVDYIRKTGEIDLEALIQQIEKTNAAPQALFELDRGEKHYRVWLK